MQINIPGTHQRHSILLNIFPLRRWCEHCRSSQQSRKSQTDSSIGNNGLNQRRLRGNTRYLVFVLLGASCVLFLYYHTFQLRDWLSDSVVSSKSYHVHHNTKLHGCRQGSRANHLFLILSIKKDRLKSWLEYFPTKTCSLFANLGLNLGRKGILKYALR